MMIKEKQKCGQEVQRASVISNLPCLVRQNPAETSVGLYQSPVVSNAWLETLLSAINALPKETIKQEHVSCMSIRVDDIRTELLPELVELAGDEDSSVRLAAFDTIINLMEMIDSDEQRGRLLQRFKVLCVTGLQTEENPIEINESKLIRCNCCYNLPAMVMFADSTHFLSELYPSFSSLCCDPEVSVRRSAAASFHQVVKLLGSNVQVVHKELLVLLQDDALEVLDALMNHLEETLEVVLSRGENPTLDNKFPELLSALLMAEQKVGCSLRWRLHEKLLQRYSCLARLLPGELLHKSFSPRIFIILTTMSVLLEPQM
ncbi:hypothetical protein INR49_010466 [Caranx melampygus]|nr:hypothetical protein INR49_010466 [Caranx melampygus]